MTDAFGPKHQLYFQHIPQQDICTLFQIKLTVAFGEFIVTLKHPYASVVMKTYVDCEESSTANKTCDAPKLTLRICFQRMSFHSMVKAEEMNIPRYIHKQYGRVSVSFCPSTNTMQIHPAPNTYVYHAKLYFTRIHYFSNA